MTRFVVQYLTEATDGASNIETVFVESSSEDNAKQLVVNRCGAFINILSVAKTKSDGGVGIIESAATAVALAAVKETPVKTVKTITPKAEKPAKPAKEVEGSKQKPTVPAGEKKVTNTSRVREQIAIAKAAGQGQDVVVLWCMDNLGHTIQLAKSYAKSQWDRA